MSAIGPGDWVECVDASLYHGQPNGLSVGAVYRVKELLDCPIDGPGCSLVGVSPPVARKRGYLLSRFRPIYRPRKGAFDHLLKPMDIKVDA